MTSAAVSLALSTAYDDDVRLKLPEFFPLVVGTRVEAAGEEGVEFGAGLCASSFDSKLSSESLLDRLGAARFGETRVAFSVLFCSGVGRCCLR